MGPNAVGAYRAWLEEEERAGRFAIVALQLRAQFCRAVSAYGGTPPTPEEVEEAFARPYWSPHRPAVPPSAASGR